MDDIVKSLKAHLYERATSPLFFSFALSWALWNYRFLLVLTASGSLVEKFAFIEAHLFSTWWDYVGRGFVGPAVSALLYIFLYPIPSRFVYSFTQKQQAKLKKIQQEIEDETPITQEYARELRGQIRQAAADFDKALEESNKTIKRLTEDLARIEENHVVPAVEAISTSSSLEQIAERLTPAQIDILRMVGSAASDFDEDTYLESDKDGSRIARRYNLDKLQEYGLLSIDKANNGFRWLTTTPKGRAIAVNYGLSESEQIARS